MLSSLFIRIAITVGYLYVSCASQILQWTAISPKTYPIKDKRIVGNALSFDQEFSLVISCFIACQWRESCKSYNYHPALGNCELNANSFDEEPSKLEDAEGFDYYPRSSWILDGVSSN